MNLRKKLKRLLPPALVDEWRRASAGAIRFSGDYPNWQAARNVATGYDADEILRRVVEATRQVVAGKAAFERDSVVFAEPSYVYPVLAALMRTAALNQGHLRVIDFGGSLGTTYRQHRPFLQGLASIRWSVVEQAKFVEAGAREFSTAELGFVSSLDDVPRREQPGIAILSSVLQYLEHPLQILSDLARTGATSLLIDRTPMSALNRDRLCLQTVPGRIYSASYPCWLFSKARLMAQLARDWNLLGEFDCEEGQFLTRDRLRFRFRGLIGERRT